MLGRVIVIIKLIILTLKVLMTIISKLIIGYLDADTAFCLWDWYKHRFTGNPWPHNLYLDTTRMQRDAFAEYQYLISPTNVFRDA